MNEKFVLPTCCLRAAILSGGTFDVSWGTSAPSPYMRILGFKKSSGVWGMGDKAVPLASGRRVMNRKLLEVN